MIIKTDEAEARIMSQTPVSEVRDRGYYYDRELVKKNIGREESGYVHAFSFALIWLLKNRPFYAYMFNDIVRRCTHDVPTLGIGVKDGRIVIGYNPDFMAIHTLKQNVGFLQHEIGHLLQGHLGIKKHESVEDAHDPLLPTAVDLAVDTLLQDPGTQPPWVLLPRDVLVPEPGVEKEKWKPAIERRTWKYYLEVLRRGREEGLSAALRGLLSRFPVADGQESDEPRASFDDHGAWDDSDDHEIVKEVVRQAVITAKAAAEKHGKSSMRGYMPGELMNMIDELMKESSVPFERFLRAYIGSRLSVRRRATFHRLSRRRRVPPGQTLERSLRVLWAADDSGSVSDEEAALLRNELFHACRQYNMSVVFQRFCHGLVGPLVDLDRVDFKHVTQRASGGTDFEAVIELAERLRPDVLFIATDGQAPTPSRRPPCPVAWILTHDGESHPWGTVIRLPAKAEILGGRKAAIERWL